MPKILIVKTTSLGDLIHSMPAVTDVQRMLPDAEVHWLVEESFAAVPTWHPFVKKVHRCAIRRWKKSLTSASTRKEIRSLKQGLISEKFDVVIDAQGLLKSAWMVRWLPCPRHGYDKDSIKEKLASRVYKARYAIDRDLEAIERVRQLFSHSLGYSIDDLSQQFGLQVRKPDDFDIDISSRYVVFLHGTNWDSKIWPVSYWNKLAVQLTAEGMQIFIPWGDEIEKERARQIAIGTTAIVLTRQSLTSLAYLLQNAFVVVGSDTGLTHLAAALAANTIGIYGSTSTRLTGLNGENVNSLQSDKACSPCMKRHCPLVKDGEIIPCYASVDVQRVLKELRDISGD